MASPAIEVEALDFVYGRVPALRDVSFRIVPGAVTALVGPNGAGKSTLMRCIAALQRPLAGRIRINGIDVLAEPRASHRHLGYLADFFGLYETLSVRRCLHHAAAIQHVPEFGIPAAVDRALDDLDLGPQSDARVAELSRGQRQRVGIAQAIIHRPSVLLLDEPASGLDPEARAHLSELFLRLAGTGMTLLVSSHILSELEAYCSEMLILEGGRLVDQQALDAGLEAVPETAFWRLTLAWPVADFETRVADTAAVHSFEGEGRDWTVCLPVDAGARAAILAAWVDAGLPVADLARIRTDLQSSYVRRVRAARGRAPFEP